MTRTDTLINYLGKEVSKYVILFMTSRFQLVVKLNPLYLYYQLCYVKDRSSLNFTSLFLCYGLYTNIKSLCVRLVPVKTHPFTTISLVYYG